MSSARVGEKSTLAKEMANLLDESTANAVSGHVVEVELVLPERVCPEG